MSLDLINDIEDIIIIVTEDLSRERDILVLARSPLLKSTFELMEINVLVKFMLQETVYIRHSTPSLRWHQELYWRNLLERADPSSSSDKKMHESGH
jgi:hypothetical protein